MRVRPAPRPALTAAAAARTTDFFAYKTMLTRRPPAVVARETLCSLLKSQSHGYTARWDGMATNVEPRLAWCIAHVETHHHPTDAPWSLSVCSSTSPPVANQLAVTELNRPPSSCP